MTLYVFLRPGYPKTPTSLNLKTTYTLKYLTFLRQIVVLPGVSAYTKVNVNITLLKTDISLHWQIASFLLTDALNHSYIFTVIYRHPLSDTTDFVESLNNYLDSLNNSHPQIPKFITGDINIDLNHIRYDHPYSILMRSNAYTQGISSPTRITLTSATLIDHIYVPCDFTAANTNTQSGVIKSSPITDHQMTYISISCTPTSTTHNNLNHRNYSPQNKIIFYNRISEIYFPSVNINDNLELKVQHFIDIVTLNFHECFPPKSPQNTTVSKKPWITRAILQQIKTKDRLYKIFKHTYLQVDFISYKTHLKNLRGAIKCSKAAYYRNQLSNAKPADRWKLAKELLPDKILKTPITQIKHNDATYTNKTDIATILNKSFCKANTTINPETHIFDPPTCNSIYISQITPETVQSKINRLKPTRSFVENDIPSHLWKLISPLITTHLSQLFNLSLSQAHFPEPFKLTKIIPVFKKGDRTDPGNYRPIAITNFLGKTFEAIVLDIVTNFFNKFKIINTHQFGFRKKHSASTAVAYFIIRCQQILNRKHCCAALLIDLSKAFDSIHHQILLNKLKHYGLREPLNSWLKSFLLNRPAYTVVETISSPRILYNAGVPQGGVLSPTLYSLYTNDILSFLSSTAILYADDTTAIISASNINILKNNIITAFKQLVEYFHLNLLLVNPSKTQLIVFRHTEPLIIKLTNSFLITSANHVKLLGYCINNKLSLDNHTSTLISKIAFYKHIFRALRNSIDIPTKKLLFHAYIISHINYALPFLSTCTNTSLSTITKKYNAALKTLFSFPMLTRTTTIYELTKLPTIHSLIENSQYSFVKKYMNHSHPPALQTLIEETLPRPTHRPARNTQIRLYHTENNPIKDFLFGAIRHWNQCN